MSIIDKKKIAQSFGLAANTYDSVAHFQRWVGNSLLKKIPEFTPKTVLDLGSGTGYFSESIHAKFPYAQYIGLDLSEGMARFAKERHSSDYFWVTGDADSLPIKSNSVDIIFSSLAIQWCSNLPLLMTEIQRVLSPNGCFVFSTLIDGSLVELKKAWAAVDDNQHVNDFFLKNDYSDAIAKAGLVVDVLAEETKVLKYQRLTELMRELKDLGAHNLNNERSTGLMGKKKLSAVISSYEQFRIEHEVEHTTEQSFLPASYEILWGVLTKNERNP